MTCHNITTQAEYDARKDEAGACLHIAKGRLVVAYGSASVVASGSASVVAYGSASVRAYDSASVEAYGSASVQAYDSASVQAGTCVPVQQFPGYKGTTTGGVVIKIPDLYKVSPAEWIAFYALRPADGKVTVYKAVSKDLVSGHGMTYPLGGTVTAPDWDAVRESGQGLHFGPTPRHAARYHSGAARYLACEIDADGLVPLGDKVKAASCLVVAEVDVHGKPVEGEVKVS
jgi:hypothetical protein